MMLWVTSAVWTKVFWLEGLKSLVRISNASWTARMIRSLMLSEVERGWGRVQLGFR
ncbi:hypothetical protein SK128_008517, partial [Halocaridina rubra]